MFRSTKNAEIAAIFFDLDNTLIATRHADKLTCNKLTKVLHEKYDIPKEQAVPICTSYLRNFRKCPENPTLDLDSWRILLWKEALGQQYESFADEIYPTWLNLRYHYLAIPQEIQTLLHKLHQHYFLALITNGTSGAQWEKVHRLELGSYFDIVLVSGDLRWEKPHHKIFHEACHYLGVEPNQCIMVGDKIETDIQGAVQAKLGGSVWIPLNSVDQGHAEFHPDYVLKSVMELPSILPKNPKVPAFRSKNRCRLVPDFDDCNSNSSDGS